jgi:uncharacterized protein
MREVPQRQARLLLLQRQGLIGGPKALEPMLQQLGFVQLDSIVTVARAHELTLHARLPRYRHESCFELLPQGRAFEHWTHDASLLPAAAWPYWSRRCHGEAARIRRSKWWGERMGDHADATLQRVLERIAREGPLQSRDFENTSAKTGGWWNWKPEKAALEYLWRSGALSVVGRRNFQKIYDLSERHLGRPPEEVPADLVDWACSSALDRLGVATPTELAQFWELVSREEARAWAATADVEHVLDSGGRAAVAVRGWDAPLQAPRGTRLLAPFDPILRDRKRALRLFDFTFRFEGFVPAAQREHGYYTLPILQGEHLTGRMALKLQRKQQRLQTVKLTWEEGRKPAVARVQQALDRLAAFLGAEADRL